MGTCQLKKYGTFLFTLPLVLQPAKSIISQNDVSRFASCINYQTSVIEVLLLLSGEKKRDKQVNKQNS